MIKSSIARKIAMALSGFFLLFFLAQHFSINALSVISPDYFNAASHFMGTNPLVQFALQPVLMLGFIFHLTMGIVLELKNRSSRDVKYAYNNAKANSSWVSRNMIITGVMVLLFLLLHLNDFWLHEMIVKFGNGDWTGLNEAGEMRYFHELQLALSNPLRVGVYVLAFLFLGLHLSHGFQSAFQSVGANHDKYTPIIKKVGMVFSILIPAGFAFIALFHYINSL